MITTSMLKRQVWMADDKFEHVVKNLQRVLRLNNQYKNHLYVEEYTKSVMLCLYMKHTFWRERQTLNFLWVIYGIYFRKTPYQRKLFAGN